MFKRIVFLISSDPKIQNFVFELTRLHSARLILLALIDQKPLMQLVQDSGRDELAVREELKSKAWSNLYELEFNIEKSGLKGLEIALAVEECSLFEIQPFLKAVKADLLILPIEFLRFYNYTITEKFLADLPCPVLLLGKS